MTADEDQTSIQQGKEEVQNRRYEEYYSDLFYRLLPAVYQNRDNKQDNGRRPLEQFLKVIAEKAALMRRDIDGLWGDLFIDTCNAWVIPYIGDLVGTNILLNEAARNRSDVKRTIFWRKRKGTIFALEDLANFITGWSAKAVEFFQILIWSQNLTSLKFNHNQTPNMSNNLVLLDKIYTAYDKTCHNIDLRNPDQSLGWYNIKNVGFYFSRLQIFQIKNGSALEITSGLNPTSSGLRFYFDPPWKSFTVSNNTPLLYNKKMKFARPPPLYDKLTRQPISIADFTADPYAYFGNDSSRGMSVNIYNVLAAAPAQKRGGIENLERFAGRVATTNIKFLQFEKLNVENGIWLLEPRKFTNPRWNYEISIIDWKKTSNSISTLTPLGKINTSDPASFVKQQEVTPSDKGYTLVKVKTDDGDSDPGVFPDTIIGIKRDTQNKAADSLSSRFESALYVYLPEVFLALGEEIFLLIAEDGTTFYTIIDKFRKGAPQTYPKSNPDPEIVRKTQNIARRSLGQIFPSRSMSSNSYVPANGFLKLNRDHGIIVPDKSRLLGAFIITVYSKSSQARSTVPLASLDTSAGGKYEIYQPDTLEGKNNLAIAQEDGTLLISIKPVDGSLNPVFSMNEIILMDRSNQSLLIYIPEIGGTESDTNERYKWDKDGDIQKIKYFYPADDGSVYFCSPDETKYDQLGQQSEDINNAMKRKRTVFSIGNIARKSAGQILPIPEHVPIRFRIPVAHPLGEGSLEFTPLQGELAIDPARGMFCFPAQDFLGMNMLAKQYISTSYNYGFPAVIGAGPHDRTVLFGADKKKIKDNDDDNNNNDGNKENSPSKKYSRLKKPTIWVTKSLDVVDSDANGNVIFDTLGKALEAAKKNGEGEVVIQIQDSALYIEDAIDFQSSAIENLTIQAINEQRPIVLIKDNGMNIIKSNLKSLTFNGLQILSYDASTTTASFGASTTNTNADTDNAIIKVSSNLSQICIISSTINPSLKALDFEFEQQEGNDSISADFVIDKSIVGGIDTGTARVNLNINNSIVDDGDKDALVGIRLGCDIDRSTILGNVSISSLNASETIFEGLVMVKDRQEGCVRYSKYTQNSYLFDWNKVKEQNGDDNEKLKKFLVRNFNDTGWVKDADITNDGKTITIKSLETTNPKSIMLNLDNEKKGADFVLDNKVYHFAAKMKEGNELGIFAYSIFPRLYRCTDATPLFNSRHPWDPHYLQLNVKCNKDILQGAENKSEMGVYYYGYFSLGVNNFRIKLREYLPLMLKPAIIMEDK